MTARITVLLALFLVAPRYTASAQYFDQLAIADFLNRRAESLEAVPEISYDYYVLTSGTGNSVYARNTFFLVLGEGQAKEGQDRAMLVGLLNRTTMDEVFVGDTLVVPTQFDLDFRGYSPFPRYYTGGREFDKLFIMDKALQAFAAYEYGELVRWGIINTGNPEESPTPNGRYNFNWREEYRVSSLSPPGEEWEMYWVLNFYLERGMHIHQYEMPTGGPLSHGCVRLVDADAEWAYNWADTWKTTIPGDSYASGSGRILEQGTTVLVIGTEPEGKPKPFEFKEYGPVLKHIDLPVHPYDVPPGTAQQKYFDRRRPAVEVIAAAEEEPPFVEEESVAETLTENEPPLVEPQSDDEISLAGQDQPADDELQPLPFVNTGRTDNEQLAVGEPASNEEQADAVTPEDDEQLDDNEQTDEDQQAVSVADASLAEQINDDLTPADEEQRADDHEILVDDEILVDAEQLAENEQEEPIDNLALPEEAEQLLLVVEEQTNDDLPPADQEQRAQVEQPADDEQTDEDQQAVPVIEEPVVEEQTNDDLPPADEEQRAQVEQPADDDAEAQPAEEEAPLQPAQQPGPERFDRQRTSWTIVVASYPAQADAEAAAAQYHEQIGSRGYLIDVIEAFAAGAVSYRVILGQFESLATTLTTQQELGDAIPNNAWQFYLEGTTTDVEQPLAEAANIETPAGNLTPADEEQRADDLEILVDDEQLAENEQEEPIDDLALPEEAEQLLLVVEEQTNDDLTPADEEQRAQVEQPADDDAEAQPAEEEAPLQPAQQPGPERFDRQQTSWTIVVASYPAQADAEAAAAQYREQIGSRGYLIDVIEAFAAGASEHRVVLGQFETLVASSTVQQELGDAIPNDAWLLYVEQEP